MKSIKAIRNLTQAGVVRAAAMLESSVRPSVMPQAVQRFAGTARERIRIDGDGYRRDHLCTLAHDVCPRDCERGVIP